LKAIPRPRGEGPALAEQDRTWNYRRDGDWFGECLRGGEEETPPTTVAVFPRYGYPDGHSLQTMAMSRTAVPRAYVAVVINRDINLSSPVTKVKPRDEDFVKNG